MAVLSYSMGRGCRSLGMFRNLRSSLRTRRALGGGTAHRLREMRTDLSIRAAATDRNTRYIMAEAAFASLVVQLTSPFYQLFAQEMGATDTAIGYISSLPAFCALFVLLPVSARIDYQKDKKKFLNLMILVCGAALPLVALAPFLGAYGYWFFIVGVGIWNAPYICYTIAWQGYFSDLFPPDRRSIPYARRMMVNNLVPMFTELICGLTLTYVCRTHAEKILAYQLFFLIAFLASILQFRAIKRTECPPRPAPASPRTGFFATFAQVPRELRQNKKYRSFLILLFLFYFSWQMAWPLFYLYLVPYSGFSELQKCTLDVVSYLCFAATATWWGKYIQRRGPKKPTLVGFIGCFLCPTMTVLSTNFISVIVAYLVSGLTAPGFQLGLFNDMLEQLPEERKSLNIGIYNMVTQVSNVIAPLTGVAIYKAIGLIDTMHVSSALRALTAGFFLIRYLMWRKKKDAEKSEVSA